MGFFSNQRCLPIVLILSLLFPSVLQAACRGGEDPAFNLLVAQGNYAGALHFILKEVRVPPEEAGRFYLDPSVSSQSPELHGQADADTQQVHIDPGLFLEGESGACQGIAHELQHLRQFKRDHQKLHTFFSQANPPSTTGWSGCDRDELQAADTAHLEEEAYSCLQNDELSTHSAAGDIEAVLAQNPYTEKGQLRDEDLDYLQENLKTFAAHVSMLADRSNEAYYLPTIKKEDLRIFCRGGFYIRQNHLNSGAFDGVWLPYCRNIKG